MMTLKELVERHPRMTERATILCEDGWAWIIDIFLSEVSALERRYCHVGEVRLLCADEHMAELDLRVDYGNAKGDEAFVSGVLDALDSAILRSRHYCETCGGRGALRCDEIGWLTVACDTHAGADSAEMSSSYRRQVGGRVYELDPVSGTVTATGTR